MKLINIGTNEIILETPKTIMANGALISNPSIETLNGLGWYEFEERAFVAPSKSLISSEWTLIGSSAVETIVTADREVSPSVMEQACAFRSVLRRHFGSSSETNPSLTKDVVKRYFAMKKMADEGETGDALDFAVLSIGFETIQQWTGDGTTVSFPWDKVDNYLSAAPATSFFVSGAGIPQINGTYVLTNSANNFYQNASGAVLTGGDELPSKWLFMYDGDDRYEGFAFSFTPLEMAFKVVSEGVAPAPVVPH